MNNKKNTKRTILLIVVIVVVLAVIAGAVVFIERGMNPTRGTNSGQHITEQVLYFGDDEYTVTHNIETYLIIGVDDSQKLIRVDDVEPETNEDGKPVYRDGTGEIVDPEDIVTREWAKSEDGYQGEMADFLLLLVLDRTENTYGIVQVNRNTMTDVPIMDAQGNGEDTAFEQICISHWYGGNEEMSCNNTSFCVSELLGEVKINGYYQLSMDAISALNHAVGGVTVTIEDDFSKVDPTLKMGETVTLTDEQAVTFIRGRMGIGEEDNEGRMRRQKQYMEALRNQAFSQMDTNKNFADELLDALSDYAYTNMPKSSLSKIANQVYKSSYLGIKSFEGKTEENDTFHDGILHEEFYADTQSIANIMAEFCGIDAAHIHIYGEDSEYFDKLEQDMDEEAASEELEDELEAKESGEDANK